MYRMIGNDIVEISGILPASNYNRQSLLKAIETIQLNRHQYISDEAYKKDLERLQGALRFLDSRINISPT